MHLAGGVEDRRLGGAEQGRGLVVQQEGRAEALVGFEETVAQGLNMGLASACEAAGARPEMPRAWVESM